MEGILPDERKRQEVRNHRHCHYYSEKEMKLLQAIFELISTEAAYVRDLQLIVEVSNGLDLIQTDIFYLFFWDSISTLTSSRFSIVTL